MSASSFPAAGKERQEIKIHQVARSGFDTSGASGLYDRARPSYPDEVIDKILAAPGRESLKVIELGPGTGISTGALLGRAAASQVENQTPAFKIEQYQGFEPSDGMRAHFQKSVLDNLVPRLRELTQQQQLHGGVTIADGAFDAFAHRAGTNANDLVLIAQAWHWCLDFDAALREIASTLRTGGVLALLWNIEDRDAARWVARARDCFEAYEGGAPQYRQMKWKAMYDVPAYSELFEPLPEIHVTRVIPTTMEGVHERVLSKSYITLLPPEVQADVKRGLDAIFDAEDEALGRRWIDKEKGIFEYPYRTSLYMFVKK
ncbi:hypothetical protein K437DRAFT_260286 [Tilletiaria anomala UBC 951]|uniref:Methyltransferase type 11 domain-containing protein n=1 Tax=Tilletiaria anomala (strain ATCC 24038 / CBS 436.72 / UBC 951) TaxID=1037660 RepID=A0A066V6I8_TILAU|nr:uncharacterized protein K437DRAFT_260286 [Tilletiaria anomala UBC 951]KDN35858.1 hypothetical protein K437DRAFT_260286 [Tilletiaria anomala UBC 951]